MWSKCAYCILFIFCHVTCLLGRPANLKIISSVGELNENDHIGANIDTLLTQMYNDIIKSRLENLLQGVEKNSAHKSQSGSGFSSSDIVSELRFKNAPTSTETNEKVEVFLPESVTQIPLKLFTSLPGTARHKLRKKIKSEVNSMSGKIQMTNIALNFKGKKPLISPYPSLHDVAINILSDIAEKRTKHKYINKKNMKFWSFE